MHFASIRRWLLWLLLYLGAFFCWIVLIEHGLDDFWEGAKIEIQNLQTLLHGRQH